MNNNCVNIPLLQVGVENKNKTVISDKAIKENFTKAQYSLIKRLCWIANNSIYGLYPRGGHHITVPYTMELLWYQSGRLLNEIIRTAKDGRVDFDIAYESVLFKNRFYNKYKIFFITSIDDYSIYFLEDYSHLKYHINFRDLRVGVSSDFKYRSSNSCWKWRKMVQK